MKSFNYLKRSNQNSTVPIIFGGLVFLALPQPAHAACLDPSCCFGTNAHAALAILGGMMMAAAFPLLGAAGTGLEALLGDLLGNDKAAGGLAGIAPASGTSAGRVVPHDDGSFSIVSWGGYPPGAPIPAGPFRPVDLSGGSAGLSAAAGAPQILHVPTGMVAYPVTPLLLGGSATDPSNWTIVTPATAARLDQWWGGVLTHEAQAGSISVAGDKPAGAANGKAEL